MGKHVNASILIKNITKIYNQNTPKPFVALDNISLDIQSGDSLALLGHNGAGKTTLIKIITTLLQPTFGTATIGGMDLHEDPTLIKYIIGYTTQDVSLDVNLNVIQTLQLQSMYYGILDNQKTIDYLLDVTDLHSNTKTMVRHLSGGMKRRLMIAKALVQNPKIVILDEPTVGIDLVLKEKIVSCIQALREQGKTIVLTTHSFDEVERLCNMVSIFQKGKKVYFGTMENLQGKQEDALHFAIDFSKSPAGYQLQLEEMISRGEIISKITSSQVENGELILGHNDAKGDKLSQEAPKGVIVTNSPSGIEKAYQASQKLNAPILGISEKKVSKYEAIENLMRRYAKY